MNENPLVSAVVTTFNEEKNIENCLISIKEQTYKNIETIVVDNNSSDRTKELSLEYTKNVYNKGPERSAQRNYGMIEKSNGYYVIFIDADMILAPYLIESCVYHIQNNSDIALHINEIILGKNFFSKVRRFERTFYNGTVIDGARFFNKSFFKKVGGFDEGMSGPEDWDIDKKIKKNGSIGLLKNYHQERLDWSLNEFVIGRGVKPYDFSNSIFHNESDFVLNQYLNKKKYYAKSFDVYINKWGRDDKDVKKQLGLKYRYFGVFIESGKFLKLLTHPILSLGMYFLRIMVGLNFLMKNL
jgi:glycosyltransferase involved in cell wall biosynthesis